MSLNSFPVLQVWWCRLDLLTVLVVLNVLMVHWSNWMFSEMASVSSSTAQATDWTKCFCQLDSKEPLIAPTDTGFETTAINIIQFSDLHHINDGANEMFHGKSKGGGICSLFRNLRG